MNIDRVPDNDEKCFTIYVFLIFVSEGVVLSCNSEVNQTVFILDKSDTELLNLSTGVGYIPSTFRYPSSLSLSRLSHDFYVRSPFLNTLNSTFVVFIWGNLTHEYQENRIFTFTWVFVRTCERLYRCFRFNRRIQFFLFHFYLYIYLSCRFSGLIFRRVGLTGPLFSSTSCRNGSEFTDNVFFRSIILLGHHNVVYLDARVNLIRGENIRNKTKDVWTDI